MTYYKVARPDGFDFRTGKTINYRENIGKIVKCPNQNESENELCSDNVIHASEMFIDALSYSKIPCSIYIVSGTPVSRQYDKCGFKKLKVLEEIPTIYLQRALTDWMIWILRQAKTHVDKKHTKQLNAMDNVIRLYEESKKRQVDKQEWLDAARTAANAAYITDTANAAYITDTANAADAAANAAKTAAYTAAYITTYIATKATNTAAYAADAAAYMAAHTAVYTAHAAAAYMAADSEYKSKKQEYSEKIIEILKSYN
jgi:hypothetical protein